MAVEKLEQTYYNYKKTEHSFVPRKYFTGGDIAMENDKYIQLIIQLVQKNKDKAKDIYFLILGYLGNSD